MTALVQTREGLIVFSDDIDYEDFSLGKFILFSSFDKMTFRKRFIYVFQIPERIATYEGAVCNGMEALCILLK